MNCHWTIETQIQTHNPYIYNNEKHENFFRIYGELLSIWP
jgi:hypothetical protein